MKYISTYENFNYQPTNEELIGLFSAETRNQYIKQGFENGLILIEKDKSLQEQIKKAYNSLKEKPSMDEIKDAVDIVSGGDDPQIQSLEKELKADVLEIPTDPVTSGETKNESTTEPKTFIQKALGILSKIWKFGVNLVHFMGALAMIILPFTAQLGAKIQTYGETSGNVSMTWYGGLLFVGGLVAMLHFIWRNVASDEKK